MAQSLKTTVSDLIAARFQDKDLRSQLWEKAFSLFGHMRNNKLSLNSDMHANELVELTLKPVAILEQAIETQQAEIKRLEERLSKTTTALRKIQEERKRERKAALEAAIATAEGAGVA